MIHSKYSLEKMAPPEQTIKSVQALHVGQFMFARVETDQGLVGYGEAGIWGHIAAAGTVIERLRNILWGKEHLISSIIGM